MELLNAIDALAALAHETRLEIFRLLVRRGPEGLAVHQIMTSVTVPATTLSFHLSHLQRAGLIHARRDGRQIIYSAHHALMKDLMGFLTDNCCQDASENTCCVGDTECPG